jgi:invasion protein IalB
MMTRLLSLPLGATLALTLALGALPALAQDTTTDSTATQPAAQPEVSMGLPAGMPDKATAQVGQLYLAAAFELWELRCFKTADGKDPCQLYQLLLGADKSPVAEVSFFTLPEGGQAAAGATIVAPLETLLTANMRIAVDGTPGKLYPYSFCNINGCVAKVGFTADEVTAMQNGGAAVITIVPAAAPDKTVLIDMSLKGFTAGYEALKAIPK